MPDTVTTAAGRRALQVVVAVLAAVPTTAGLAGVVLGPAAFGVSEADSTSLDSHVRFLSGVFLAIGLCFYSTVRRIERHRTRFRLAAAAVFVGGLGRLLSLILMGAPEWPHLVGLALELLVVPALVIWQGAVARAAETQAPSNRAVPGAP